MSQSEYETADHGKVVFEHRPRFSSTEVEYAEDVEGLVETMTSKLKYAYYEVAFIVQMDNGTPIRIVQFTDKWTGVVMRWRVRDENALVPVFKDKIRASVRNVSAIMPELTKLNKDWSEAVIRWAGCELKFSTSLTVNWGEHTNYAHEKLSVSMRPNDNEGSFSFERDQTTEWGMSKKKDA